MAEERTYRISLDAAAALTRRYREGHAGAEKGGSFSREAVERLLAQKGCAGIRFYYGRHPDGRDALVVVGMDEKGNDMVQGEMLEDSAPCPPFCGDGNALNS